MLPNVEIEVKAVAENYVVFLHVDGMYRTNAFPTFQLANDNALMALEIFSNLERSKQLWNEIADAAASTHPL